MIRRFQVLVAVLAMFLSPGWQRAAVPEIAAQIRAESEALIRLAVQKPYGWAWPSETPDNQPLPRGAKLVSFDPLSTPSAGLVLFWAGQELQKQQYMDAARQAARGVLASQQTSGRIPSRLLFGSSATGRDANAQFPDRAPTCAGLSLLLTLLEAQPDNEPIKRGSTRAALWLSRQQPPTGGWPVSIQSDDADSPPIRLIRLDTPDYRNSTLALAYAGQVLKEPLLRSAVDRATERLLKMRLEPSKSAKGLWQGVYDLDGSPSDKLPQHYHAIDALASRHAMQTLLGIQIVSGGEASLASLQMPAGSLQKLRGENGQWRRLYPLKGNEIPPNAREAVSEDDGDIFTSRKPGEENLQAVGTFGLPGVLSSVERLTRDGRGNHGFRRLAEVLAGLSDELELLASPKEARQFLDEHHELWKLTDGPPPEIVSLRVKRLGVLLLRLKMEQMAGG